MPRPSVGATGAFRRLVRLCRALGHPRNGRTEELHTSCKARQGSQDSTNGNGMMVCVPSWQGYGFYTCTSSFRTVLEGRDDMIFSHLYKWAPLIRHDKFGGNTGRVVRALIRASFCECQIGSLYFSISCSNAFGKHYGFTYGFPLYGIHGVSGI